MGVCDCKRAEKEMNQERIAAWDAKIKVERRNLGGCSRGVAEPRSNYFKMAYDHASSICILLILLHSSNFILLAICLCFLLSLLFSAICPSFLLILLCIFPVFNYALPCYHTIQLLSVLIRTRVVYYRPIHHLLVSSVGCYHVPDLCCHVSDIKHGVCTKTTGLTY